MRFIFLLSLIFSSVFPHANAAETTQKLLREIRLMRQEISDLRVEIQRLERQQQVRYDHLENRLSTVETDVAALPTATTTIMMTPPATSRSVSQPSTPKVFVHQPPPILPESTTKTPGIAKSDASAKEADTLFQQGFDALLGSRYAEATQDFSGFVEKYPAHAEAPNAYYWSGEAYYLQNDYQSALRNYQFVIKNYPQAEKYPDALLKAGYSLAELKRYDEAKSYLQRVTEEFANEPVAGLAERKLQLIDLLNPGTP